MNAAVNVTTSEVLQGIEPMSQEMSNRLSELLKRLVPASQHPVTGYAELLRVTTQLYQILHTRYYTFGRLPYEAYILHRFKDDIEARMTHPENLDIVLRMLTQGNSPDVKGLSVFDPVFEDILVAVINFVDTCVITRQNAGQDPTLPVGLVSDSDHELYQVEKALVGRHLRGVRAQSLEGELFRAMRRVAQAIDVSGLYKEDLHYELTLMMKFLCDIDEACEGVDVCDLFAELNYLHSQQTPLQAQGWKYQAAFAEVSLTVVRLVAKSENLV